MTTQRCEQCGKEFAPAVHGADWCDRCLRGYFQQCDEYDYVERRAEEYARYRDLKKRRAQALADGVPEDLLINLRDVDPAWPF